MAYIRKVLWQSRMLQVTHIVLDLFDNSIPCHLWPWWHNRAQIGNQRWSWLQWSRTFLQTLFALLTIHCKSAHVVLLTLLQHKQLMTALYAYWIALGAPTTLSTAAASCNLIASTAGCGASAHLGAFHSFVKGLLRAQTCREFLLGETSICIEVQSTDNRHAFSCRGQVVVLSEEWFQIFFVNVAILPIIDGIEG